MVLSSCWQQRVDRDRQLPVEVAESAEVVGGQFNGDPVVDVAPVGMVPACLSEQGHLAHETEGLNKIAEREVASQPIRRQRPQRQSRAELLFLVASEQGGHENLKGSTHPILLTLLCEDVANSQASDGDNSTATLPLFLHRVSAQHCVHPGHLNGWPCSGSARGKEG